MKKQFTIAALLLLSTLIFACKKFDQDPVYNDYFFKAQKNGVLWEATQGAYFVTSNTLTDTLTFFGSKGEENLTMAVYKINNSQYKLDSKKTKFYKTAGKDVKVSSYLLDSTASNAINMNISTFSQPISGTFNLTFNKVSGNDTIPAKVVFSQGTFTLARAIGAL